MGKLQIKTSKTLVLTVFAVIVVAVAFALGSGQRTELSFQESNPTPHQDEGLKKVAISLDHRTYTNTEELGGDSEVILLGSVRDEGKTSQDPSVGTSVDGEPIPGLVKTSFSVRVDKLLKGHADPAITVVLPGGTVGDMEYVVENTPWLSQGDSVIMYLVKGEDGRYHPLAGGSAIAVKNSAGKYTLPEAVSGERAMEVSEYKF